MGKRGWGKGIANCSEAIRLAPECAETYCNRGAAYEENGEHDKAMVDFTEAIRLDPKHAMAYYNQGVVYLQNGDVEKAIAEFTRAIRLNPKFAPAYYNRGLAYQQKGEQSKADADFAEAKRLGFRGQKRPTLQFDAGTLAFARFRARTRPSRSMRPVFRTPSLCGFRVAQNPNFGRLI